MPGPQHRTRVRRPRGDRERGRPELHRDRHDRRGSGNALRSRSPGPGPPTMWLGPWHFSRRSGRHISPRRSSMCREASSLISHPRRSSLAGDRSGSGFGPVCATLLAQAGSQRSIVARGAGTVNHVARRLQSARRQALAAEITAFGRAAQHRRRLADGEVRFRRRAPDWLRRGRCAARVAAVCRSRCRAARRRSRSAVATWSSGGGHGPSPAARPC